MKQVAFVLLFIISSSLYADFVRDGARNVVVDTNEQLMWQDDEASASVKKNYEKAKAYCVALRIGDYNNWRLPTLKELKSILDKNSIPTINSAFINITPSDYWSSTKVSSSIASIDFEDADNSLDDPVDYNYVRCVRTSK